MAGTVKKTQDDLLFIKVKAIMVSGNNDSRTGNIHNILVFLNNQEHKVIPTRSFDSLRSTIERVVSSHNTYNRKFTIDTGLKDDDNLCNDLSSMGLTIAVGIEASLNDWSGSWENVWEEWCFTGEVTDSQGEIGAIGGAREKIESATDDERIKYVMAPSQNRQEIINWIDKRQDINYEVKSSVAINTKHTDDSPSFFSRIWLMSTGNTLMWIALILWFLSIVYVPIRYMLWDNIQLSGYDNSRVIINMPIIYPDKVKSRLLKNGFPEDQVNNIPFSRLIKTDQIGRVSIINRDGVVEFEIISSQDMTLVLCYVCGLYTVLFAVVLFILAAWQKRGITNKIKHNVVNLNYDSLVLTDRNKEIMFVDNLKQAGKIIESKLH